MVQNNGISNGKRNLNGFRFFILVQNLHNQLCIEIEGGV